MRVPHRWRRSDYGNDRRPNTDRKYISSRESINRAEFIAGTASEAKESPSPRQVRWRPRILDSADKATRKNVRRKISPETFVARTPAHVRHTRQMRRRKVS